MDIKICIASDREKNKTERKKVEERDREWRASELQTQQ